MLLLSGEGSGFDSQFLHLSLIERADLFSSGLQEQTFLPLALGGWRTEWLRKHSRGIVVDECHARRPPILHRSESPGKSSVLPE